ncbi:hypothetical protein KC323_g28 [Hortaea werneckii]|nr:hypothetical protein KC323_g28 [Hortaea werneckii]
MAAILLDLLPSQAALATLHVLLLDLLNNLRLAADSHHPTYNPRGDPPTNDVVRQTAAANMPCPAWSLRHQRVEDAIVQRTERCRLEQRLRHAFPPLLTSCCFSSAERDELKCRRDRRCKQEHLRLVLGDGREEELSGGDSIQDSSVQRIGPLFRADVGDAGRRALGIGDEDKSREIKSMRIRAFKRHMVSIQQVLEPRHLILSSEGIRQIHLQRQEVDPGLGADIVSRYSALVSGFATAPAMTTTSVLAPLVLLFARLFFLPSLLFTNTKAPIDPVTKKATAAAVSARCSETHRWRVGWHPFPKLAGDLLKVSLYVVGDGVELLARIVEEFHIGVLKVVITARYCMFEDDDLSKRSTSTCNDVEVSVQNHKTQLNYHVSNLSYVFMWYRNIIKHNPCHFNSAIAKSTSKVNSNTNRNYRSSLVTGHGRSHIFINLLTSVLISLSLLTSCESLTH